MEHSSDLLSRRELLGAGAVTAIGTQVSPNARPIGANDRITMAVIGCGGMGTGHLGSLMRRSVEDNIRVTGVCDVYQRRLSRAKGIASKPIDDKTPPPADLVASLDYRRILERKDIDGVLIATPDHWHAKIAMEALEAGKHVYCEKPMTHTVEQAIALRDCVRRHKLVFQVGPQGTGNDSFWKANEAIRGGRIGKVTWAHASYNRNARVCLFNEHQKIDPTAGPDKTGEDFIDWDTWLGHKWGLAPKREWTPEHFFRFRKYFPYNGGVATDLLYHKLAPMLIAISGANGEYPLRVNASGGLYIEKDGREIPDTFLMTADYPSEWSIFLVSTLTNDAGLPDRIYGKWGTMDVGGEPLLRENGDFGPEFKMKNDGKGEAKVAIEARLDQEGNFLDAIRTGKPVHCNAELGCSTMIAIKMAVESYRKRKTLTWDSLKERVVGA